MWLPWLPAFAVEDIDTHINELEHRLQHDSLSLNEEKKVMEQIKTLKKSRRCGTAVCCAMLWPATAADSRHCIVDQTR